MVMKRYASKSMRYDTSSQLGPVQIALDNSLSRLTLIFFFLICEVDMVASILPRAGGGLSEIMYLNCLYSA